MGRIMAPEDFRYVWTLSRKTWYVRFYLWVWEASPKELTFCKLFWGYTLLWVGLPLKCLGLGGRTVGRTGRRFRQARRKHRMLRKEALADERMKLPAEELKPTRLRVTNRRVGEHTKIELPYDCEQNRALARFHRWIRVVIDFGDGTTEERNWSIPEFDHFYSAPGTYEVVVRCQKDHYDPELRKVVYTDKVVIEQTIRIKDRPRSARILEAVEEHTSKGLMHTAAFRHTASEAGTAVARSLGTVAKPASDVIAYPIRLVLRSILRAGALVFGALLVGTVAAGLLLGGSAGYHAVVESLPTLRGIAEYVGIGLGLGILSLGTAWLIWRLGVAYAVKEAVIEPAVEGVAKGGVTFRHAMLIGYKAVKSNTCPRVVVEEDED